MLLRILVALNSISTEEELSSGSRFLLFSTKSRIEEDDNYLWVPRRARLVGRPLLVCGVFREVGKVERRSVDSEFGVVGFALIFSSEMVAVDIDIL